MEIKEHQLDPIPREVTGWGNQDEVYLTIEIGNGQIGGNKVSQGDKLLAKGRLSEKTLLGMAQELKNKKIDIETNIVDVNHFTNMCILTTTFYNQNNKVLFTKIDKGEAPEGGIASFKGKYLIAFISLLILLFCNTSILKAQNTAENISFQDLETPSSPGFILLDNTPSSIEKPTTPQGFGLSVLSIFQGTGGAIEFSPFWLANHPELTADKMYKSNFPLLYNFAVSAATIKTDSSTYLAGGIRTRLLQIYSKTRISKLDFIKTQLEDLLSDPVENMKRIEDLKNEYVNIIAEDIEKPIFTIDLAAALGGGSISNSFDDLEMNRWAAWLSFHFRPKGNDFYITALTRYVNNDKYQSYTVNTDLFDTGSRLNYDINNFCISLEYIQRLNFTSNEYSDFRIAVIGSYKISDNFFLTSSFGKNFSDVNNIIALAGVNFGYSKSKIKAF